MKKFLKSEGFTWVAFAALVAMAFTYLAVGNIPTVTPQGKGWKVVAGVLAVLFYYITWFTIKETIKQNKEL
jgi:hypothetical protein